MPENGERGVGCHVDAVWFESLFAAREAAFGNGVKDNVVGGCGCGEIFFVVVDGGVGPERFNKVKVTAAANGRYLCPTNLGMGYL